jgi:hypothetical protein
MCVRRQPRADHRSPDALAQAGRAGVSLIRIKLPQSQPFVADLQRWHRNGANRPGLLCVMDSEKIALSFSLPSKETLRCPWTNRASATRVALDPGVGSTNSESSGQARSQGHAGPGHEAQGRHREMGSEESVEQSRGPVETSDGDVTALLPPGGSPRRIALPVTATFRCRCATHVWKLHRRAWEHAVPSRAEERFDLSVAASSRCPLGGLHATSS